MYNTGFGALAVAFLVMIVLGVALSFILAIPVWLLWNWLMPELFGLTTLTLVQAWGLSLLSSFLFKSTTVKSSK